MNRADLTVASPAAMKTAEITRHKAVAVAGQAAEKVPSTWKRGSRSPFLPVSHLKTPLTEYPADPHAVFGDIYKKDGIRGINKGVNAVALRQMTNWGSRMGFARLAEQGIRKVRGKREGESLGALDKIAASSFGGALGTWNQPIEVVRVEMQSMAKQTSANRPAKLTVFKWVLSSRVLLIHEGPRLMPRVVQHACVHLQGGRHQGSLPRCHSAHRARRLADGLHGLVRRVRPISRFLRDCHRASSKTDLVLSLITATSRPGSVPPRRSEGLRLAASLDTVTSQKRARAQIMQYTHSGIPWHGSRENRPSICARLVQPSRKQWVSLFSRARRMSLPCTVPPREARLERPVKTDEMSSRIQPTAHAFLLPRSLYLSADSVATLTIGSSPEPEDVSSTFPPALLSCSAMFEHLRIDSLGKIISRMATSSRTVP